MGGQKKKTLGKKKYRKRSIKTGSKLSTCTNEPIDFPDWRTLRKIALKYTFQENNDDTNNLIDFLFKKKIDKIFFWNLL